VNRAPNRKPSKLARNTNDPKTQSLEPRTAQAKQKDFSLFEWCGQTLNREDWDFTQCPELELGWCLDYERSREIVRWRNDARDWKLKYGVRKPPRGVTILGWLDELLPCFPDTPWLLIPDRNRVLAQFNHKSYFGILGETNPEHLKDDNGVFCSMATRGGVSNFAFKIVWAWPNAHLVRAFKEWLQDRRNELIEAGINGVGERPARPSRGKARDVLKKIGARRLMQAYGIDDACRITRDALGGTPLYSLEHSAWWRAKSAADTFLETHCG
jgi:hypothetical protein